MRLALTTDKGEIIMEWFGPEIAEYDFGIQKDRKTFGGDIINSIEVARTLEDLLEKAKYV